MYFMQIYNFEHCFMFHLGPPHFGGRRQYRGSAMVGLLFKRALVVSYMLLLPYWWYGLCIPLLLCFLIWKWYCQK